MLTHDCLLVWNQELLYVGGFLSRTVYERELFGIQHHWEKVATDTPGSQLLPKSHDHLHRCFLHVLKFFAFHRSTPSPKVAELLRDSFYECDASPIRLLSSVGVRAAPDIKVFDSQVAKFLKSLPMLSEHVGREAARSIEALPDPHKISPITIDDVLRALHGRPLSEEKLIFCLQWWLGLKRNDSNLSAPELLNAVTFNDTGGTEHLLSRIEYFIDREGLGAHIPRDGPLPTSLIPLNISMHFALADLTNFGWRKLNVIDWFQYISRADVMLEDPIHDFTKSPDWAERVLYTLSRAWSSLSDEVRNAAKKTFEGTNCIPTSHGLRHPDGSYLPISNDILFRKLDLPVVTFTARQLDGELRKLLSFIGVQTLIPLELLLDRQVNHLLSQHNHLLGVLRMLNTGEWNISDLINYLVRLSPPLTTQQFSKLKLSKLFSSQNNVGSSPRYCANELYPPVDIFRQLQLPVIDWDKKSKWMNESDEGKDNTPVCLLGILA